MAHGGPPISPEQRPGAAVAAARPRPRPVAMSAVHDPHLFPQTVHSLVAATLPHKPHALTESRTCVSDLTSLQRAIQTYIDASRFLNTTKKEVLTIFVDSIQALLELAATPTEFYQQALLTLFNLERYLESPGLAALLEKKSWSSQLLASPDPRDMSAQKTHTANFRDSLVGKLRALALGLLDSEQLASLNKDYQVQYLIVDGLTDQLQKDTNLKQHFELRILELMQRMIRERYRAAVIPQPDLPVDVRRKLPLADQKVPLAAELVLPLALNLETLCPGKNPVQFTLGLVGCHGLDATPLSRAARIAQRNVASQSKVAKLMKEANSDMNAQAGDNAYFDGIDKIIDTAENDFFGRNQRNYGIGQDLKTIFNAIAVGNHDYGFWGDFEYTEKLAYHWERQNNLQRVLNQVLHTYAQHDHWNMPYRYYLVVHRHFVLIVLDTNTLIFDEVQQKWFVQVVQILKRLYPKKWISVMGHHPLLYLGKRAHHECEWKIYLDGATKRMGFPGLTPGIYDVEAKRMQPTALPKDDQPHIYNNIGKFLLDLIVRNELPIDLWLAAHEHFMGVLEITLANGRVLPQVLVGSGGADLKHITNDPNNYPLTDLDKQFVTKVSSPFYAAMHGFIQLEITEQMISYQPHLVEGKLPDPVAKHGKTTHQHYGTNSGLSALHHKNPLLMRAI